MKFSQKTYVLQNPTSTFGIQKDIHDSDKNKSQEAIEIIVYIKFGENLSENFLYLLDGVFDSIKLLCFYNYFFNNNGFNLKLFIRIFYKLFIMN